VLIPEPCGLNQSRNSHLDRARIETATLYEMTDLGRSLDAPRVAMAEWADRNWQTVEAARTRCDRLRRASD
jgi:DNA-binding HxlR family transcriptional regulator